MNWGKVILISWMTFATLITAGLVFGFSQMGDCFPEPCELRACLDAKRTAGNVVWIVVAGLYCGALVLIICRGRTL
ncbi:hypothetical protein BH10PSE12_BH10PSE12_21670 [soil metagenome]